MSETDIRALIRRVAAEMGLPKRAIRITFKDRRLAEEWERIWKRVTEGSDAN